MSSSEDVKFSNVHGLYLRKYGNQNIVSMKSTIKRKTDMKVVEINELKIFLLFRAECRNPYKNFVGFLVALKKSKGHSEINGNLRG